MPSLTTEPLPLRVSSNGSGPTDIDLLRSLCWARGPERLVAAARRGEASAFSREVRRELGRRFGRGAIDPRSAAARFPLHEAEAEDVYRRFEGGDGRAALKTSDTTGLVRTAALLDGLRRFGASLNAAALWLLWREAWLNSADVVDAPEPEAPLDRALSAEILWASGLLFDGAAEARSRMKEGRRRLLAELEARTDNDGSPHAELLSILPGWFASITRAAAWAKTADVRLWDRAYSGRFDGLVRTMAILAAPDGRLLLSPHGDVRPVLREAVKRSGWKSGSPVRRLIGRLGDGPPPVPSQESVPKRADRKTPPVIQSDWAKVVISRSRWRPDADAFAVAYDQRIPSIEVLAAGRRMLDGHWGLRILADGRPIEPTADWESVCWFSDADADYVEFQWPNELGLTVCRQLLLTRRDHQLVIADAVAAPGRPDLPLEVESALPLADGVTAEARRPSRELRLDAAGLPIRVFPIALPPERIESAPGSLDAEGQGLRQRRSGHGGVYLPAVFDWNPKRREAFAEWRSLTVTEDRRRLGPAEASAHRLRVGARQLLVYRGQNGSKVKRTVLGYHHGSESVIGRFTSDGDVEPLVLVE